MAQTWLGEGGNQGRARVYRALAAKDFFSGVFGAFLVCGTGQVDIFSLQFRVALVLRALQRRNEVLDTQLYSR